MPLYSPRTPSCRTVCSRQCRMVAYGRCAPAGVRSHVNLHVLGRAREGAGRAGRGHGQWYLPPAPRQPVCHVHHNSDLLITQCMQHPSPASMARISSTMHIQPLERSLPTHGLHSANVLAHTSTAHSAVCRLHTWPRTLPCMAQAERVKQQRLADAGGCAGRGAVPGPASPPV